MLKKFNSAGEINNYIDSKIWGSFLVDDIYILGEYVKKLEAGDKYLEIGTAAGKSIASAIFQANDGVRFWTCDIVDDKGVKPKLSREEFFKEECLNRVCTFILGESIEVADTWNQGRLDMIFIDGDHSYASVKKDILAWSGLLKKGGFMLFHDYSDYQFTAHQAINELVRDSGLFKDFFIARNLGLESSIAGATKI